MAQDLPIHEKPEALEKPEDPKKLKKSGVPEEPEDPTKPDNPEDPTKPSRYGRIQRIPPGELLSPCKKTNGVGVQAEDTKICVVMVGLPARGKSLIAQKGMYCIMISGCTEAELVYSCSLSSLAVDQSQNLQRRKLSP